MMPVTVMFLRRFAVLAIGSFIAAAAMAQTCPSGPAPKIYYSCTLLNVPGYPPTCSLANPVSFSLTDAVTNGPYTLQSCETGVRWVFSDTQLTGQTVQRTFPSAGDWAVHAFIDNNTTGTTDVLLPGVLVANGYAWESLPNGNTVLESAGSVTVNVHTTYAPVHINYETQGPADPRVPPVSGTLTFAAGETDKTFSIPIVNDNKFNGNYNFDVFIYGEDNGVLPGQDTSLTVTVRDDESLPGISWSAPSYSVSENAGTAALTVVRGNGDLSVTSSVNYAVYDPSLTVVGSGTLQFAPNETSKQINVSIPNDNVWQANRTWYAKLSNPVNAGFPNAVSELNTQLTVVEDDPMPMISVGDVTVAEGNSGVQEVDVQITLTAPYPCLLFVDFTIGGTANEGSDYDPVAQTTINIPAGATHAVFPIFVRGDTAPEPDEAVTLAIHTLRADGACFTGPDRPVPVIANGTGTLTILNDDNDESPGVMRVWPNTGTTGGTTPVAIEGWNFSSDCRVRFGGADSPNVTFVSPTSLLAVTPSHTAGATDVEVTCGASQVMLPSAFTFIPPPRTRAVRH